MAARRFLAGVLSMLLPGAGQVYAGARRRGLLLVSLALALVLVATAVAAWTSVATVDRELALALLLGNAALLALRLFAVVDAARGLVVGLAVLVALTVAPHVAAGYLTVRGYQTLDAVFADEEPPCDTACDRGRVLLSTRVAAVPAWVPKDAWELALVERLGPGEVAPLDAGARVLASAQPDTQPWTTILLLGTDEGPGNVGARTDTMIVAALQHGTGRAVAFGVPRNLAQVPLGPKLTPFTEPLNALYGRSGGGERGARNLKQAISTLLGLRVDYYALVNLLGFADLVDALGGVEIRVKERLRDEVTRPAWGEPKPRIDVRPGQVKRFYGREALAYVRSRKDSSDYTRMARQRCFLVTLADQLDPVRVLRNFGSLAKTVETNVHTDIPLNRLPSLVRSVTGVDSAQTLTVTFGPAYFFGRRPTDRHPVPHIGRIQRTVRDAILHPERLRTTGSVTTSARSC